MDFDFSVSQIVAGLLFGVAGMYLIRQSKRNTNFAHMVIGLSLIVYPYFVTNDWLAWLIGFALVGLAWYLR